MESIHVLGITFGHAGPGDVCRIKEHSVGGFEAVLIELARCRQLARSMVLKMAQRSGLKMDCSECHSYAIRTVVDN